METNVTLSRANCFSILYYNNFFTFLFDLMQNRIDLYFSLVAINNAIHARNWRQNMQCEYVDK
jgi:hypothetical protein